jgi:hypothetical protein
LLFRSVRVIGNFPRLRNGGFFEAAGIVGLAVGHWNDLIAIVPGSPRQMKNRMRQEKGEQYDKQNQAEKNLPPKIIPFAWFHCGPFLPCG